jgi:reactive intermediate/imine deaminase
MKTIVVILATCLCVGAASGQEKQVIQAPGGPPGLPFSPAVRVGNLLFLSGQVGTVPGTRGVVPGGIEAETRQVMENIKRVLEFSGSSLARVVKCTVFLRDIADYATMNEVYRSYFPTEPPARSTLAASGLALNAAVEIECIAVAGASR